MNTRLSSVLTLLALSSIAAPAHAARKRHVAPHAAARASVPRHHDRFVGNGTGGDSPKVEGGGPELLLTFDDGPALDKTPKVLDLLDKHGYKAVFFVCGVHLQGKGVAAEKSRALLREVIRRGQMVGNHTIHHLFLCNKTNESKIVEEVEGNGALIAEALGQPPYLFRTPYGAHCPALNETLAKLGIRPIGWDIDPQDWRLRNAPKILASVKKSLTQLDGRAILLLHDVQAATIQALPQILDAIDEENVRREKIGRPPIKVISYDYLLGGHAPSATPADPMMGLVRGAAVAFAPFLHMLGVELPTAPTPAQP
jgi:peptidoglycan-N-acetylglucosamine deacetylase